MATHEVASDNIKCPSTEQKVIEGLAFILGHSPKEELIWPRAISTKTTGGGQRHVYSREEALAWFKASKYLDCRINAYRSREDWAIKLLGQAPDLIFIDEDEDPSSFKSRESLDRVHKRTLKTIKEKLRNAYPTVLWSGNGYHTLQPIEAFVLESESVFASFTSPSMKFLRFAEPYLSNNKADPFHSRSVSFKNCMIRIPGSHNSECVLRNNGIADHSTEVQIIQRWDGKRPAINWILRDFRRYLIQEKIDAFKEMKYIYRTNNTTTTNRSINWIESLLETAIEDHRKYALWRILAPYLTNIKKLSYDEAFGIIKDWLNKCDKITPLDFNTNDRIKSNLRAALRVGYLPISFSDLKAENRQLYGEGMDD